MGRIEPYLGVKHLDHEPVGHHAVLHHLLAPELHLQLPVQRVRATDRDPAVAQTLSSGLSEAFVQKLSQIEPGPTLAEGALPIVEGGTVVGAIAVAGGTDEQDQRCAEVALASYG